jgi:hypothetical protein
MLAAMFLVAIWLDASQPADAVPQTYAFLFFYLCFALAVAAATWSNWWRDARLAVPAHLIDMAVFAVIVFSTNGYTSPFFLVFILPLMSAAIRWGWRETAITALAVGLAVIMRAASKLTQVGESIQAAGGPPSPEQAATVAALQQRMTTATHIVAGLLGISVIAMAIGRYV